MTVSIEFAPAIRTSNRRFSEYTMSTLQYHAHRRYNTMRIEVTIPCINENIEL